MDTGQKPEEEDNLTVTLDDVEEGREVLQVAVAEQPEGEAQGTQERPPDVISADQGVELLKQQLAEAKRREEEAEAGRQREAVQRQEAERLAAERQAQVARATTSIEQAQYDAVLNAREDPDALWRGRRTSAVSDWLRQNQSSGEANEEAVRQQFIKALDENDLVPVADPNTPSHIHRLMKATAIKQLQGASPQLYDAKKVDERVLEMIGVDDPESLFAPPMPPMQPPPNPQLIAANAKMMDAQTKQAELQIKGAQAAAGMQAGNAADAVKREEIASKERIAVLDLAKTLAVHPLSEGVVDETIAQHSAPQGAVQ